MKEANTKYTVLYARLSHDDGKQGESNSIQNQRLMLEKYATDNGFENQEFMFDDGYSGTNFNRPSWKEIMNMIENDKVSTIIVSDLSRLGRNYLEIGKLTEIIFPSYDIRFISMNDSIDSLYGIDDFAPFKNVMHEMYAKDCSRKIKASTRAKAETGARVGSMPPYGYKKDPTDSKRKIVVDENTSWIVKKIYSLSAGGVGVTEIARILTSEKISNPSTYYFEQTGVKRSGYNHSTPHLWKHNMISRILEDEVHAGHTISLKSTVKSFRDKSRVDIPIDEQLSFEHTHEAIIEQELWDIVHEITSNKRRRNKVNEPNLFAGIVKCKDCGANMTLKRQNNQSRAKFTYVCGRYRKEGTDECTAHRISTVDLEDIILNDIQRLTLFAKAHTKEFAELVNRKKSTDLDRELKKIKSELDKLTKRDNQLTELFKRLYEDNVLEHIPKDIYQKLSADYLKEQKEGKELILSSEILYEKLKLEVNNLSSFLEKTKKYTDITELTSELLNVFIEKILIYEKPEKYKHNQERLIDIYYRDVGLLDVVTATDVQKAIKAV